jgi:hypothetical protein
MGVETALGASAVLGVVGSGVNIFNSYQEADALREQGDLYYSDAQIQANQLALDANLHQQSQTMQYVMSGVAIQGTPMHVLQHTIDQSQLEINSVMTRAENARNLAYKKAGNLTTEALGKGLASIGSTLLNTYSLYNTAKEGGIFDSTGSASNIWSGGSGGGFIASSGSYAGSAWGDGGAGSFGTRSFNTEFFGGV